MINKLNPMEIPLKEGPIYKTFIVIGHKNNYDVSTLDGLMEDRFYISLEGFDLL
ncbi:hypothetical protein [Paenibacillus sp. VTT E-133280]|uniref:hypothetical protein n=1 Tax=Paenibacillus sp. VTT E-133280 TaxID=1986222 RepID=UPI0015C63B02|nr:hypothetical protein [Paenibacillus sp. VTT E-133280]